MNKKILVGSILSMVILILVSFTSVVGYNSVESDVKASPLFNIRSSRAIEEESEELSCEYIGKGEEIDIPLLARYNRTELIQMIIDNVRMMDDKTYIKFVNLLFYERDNNINIDEFYLIRNNPKLLINYFIEENEKSPYTKGICTEYSGGDLCCITSQSLCLITLLITFALIFICDLIVIITGDPYRTVET